MKDSIEFGGKLSAHKYLYNGKEIQDEQLGGVNLDWYDYGARFYDPALGRFHMGFTFGFSTITAHNGTEFAFNYGWAEGWDVPNIDINKLTHKSTDGTN
ncbi:MAG: hypothetical protein ABFS32_12665 [Bacteroidota bacterium]